MSTGSSKRLEKGSLAVYQLFGNEALALRNTSGNHHADAYSFAVEVGSVFSYGFDRVADGVAVVEQDAVVASLEFVG